MFKQKVVLILEKDRKLYYFKIQRKATLASQAPPDSQAVSQKASGFEPVSSSLQKEVTEQSVTSADAAAIWDLCRMGGTERT